MIFYKVTGAFIREPSISAASVNLGVSEKVGSLTWAKYKKLRVNLGAGYVLSPYGRSSNLNAYFWTSDSHYLWKI